MSIPATTPVGRLFEFERAGVGPLDVEHSLITSVNEPATGLQWRVREVLFHREGVSTASVRVLLHSKPSKRRFLARLLDLTTSEPDVSWLGSNDESIYVTDETEIAFELTGLGATEEWRLIMVGEIVSRVL